VSRGRWRDGDGLRRGVYVLPNLITSGSLFAGFHSIASTYNGNFEKAAIGIVVGAILDGLDGRVARMTHTTTRFGVEYDSLADVISFCVAPAFLLYAFALQPLGRKPRLGGRHGHRLPARRPAEQFVLSARHRFV